MPGQANFLDDIANDLAVWVNQTATEVANAFAPGRAPFSASLTEQQKLEYYRSMLFNPDGSPNQAGRQQELNRLGAQGFGTVYKAVVNQWPDLKPPPAPPIEVPSEWPRVPPSAPGVPAPPDPLGRNGQNVTVFGPAGLPNIRIPTGPPGPLGGPPGQAPGVMPAGMGIGG